MSITLAAGQVATVTLGGVTVENDTGGAATQMNVNFAGPDIVLVLTKGVVSGSTFTAGTQTSISVTINLVTGFWISTNGLSGTLSGAALTNFQTTVKGWRNSVETFAVNNSILPGTQVAWT
jgi:hypothetical protein